MTIVVCTRSHDVLTDLIHAGLLYDMRVHDLPHCQGGVYDLIHEILHGINTRISLCNKIRDILSDHEILRWCGAEKESLFNQNIYHNAIEICGNNPPGSYLCLRNGVKEDMPKPMHEFHLRNMYNDILNTFDEPGQIKLGLIMSAIPRVGFNIIYIGGSPGTAWTYVLSKRDFRGRILYIDPDELIPHEDSNLQITHVRRMVRSVKDIANAMNASQFEPNIGIAFIWDIRRGDAGELDPINRNEVIREEASILNQIINSSWFREHVKIFQLKVNSSNIDACSFPDNTKLYVQPYTLDRNVYELRATGHVNDSNFAMKSTSATEIDALGKHYTDIKELLDNREISNYTLFLNFITGMYRECDYINMLPLANNMWEIALYTLAWNSDDKLRQYFVRIYNSSVRFIGSFFTPQQLSVNEYKFQENMLLEEFPSLVFDSRALIPAKVTGLYFFVNVRDSRYMDNELLFSESYVIGSTEYNLHSSNSMPAYDTIRTSLSRSQGHVYAKFPNSFSVNENLLSPSGHSLRMFIEYTKGNASLCMFALKIMTKNRVVGRVYCGGRQPAARGPHAARRLTPCGPRLFRK